MSDNYNETCYSHRSFEHDYNAIIREQTKEYFNTSKFKNLDDKKYILNMFPYPSGRIHVGHIRNYTIGDVLGRGYHLLGYTVFNPLGWDAFGLPAENAARNHNTSPEIWTKNNINKMTKILDSFNFFDHGIVTKVNTSNSNYYLHTQALMHKLYDMGLLYRKKSIVNWDPVDRTVLANEQIQDGKGWRSGATIEKKMMTQWFLKISSYAESLLNSLKTLKKWPNSVRTMQENWIGKSIGTLIKFNTDTDEIISVFTTKPETIFGCTFIAIAPSYITKSSYAIHPYTNKKIPILTADYVYIDYGSGAVMGVPCGDTRDAEFAKTHLLATIHIYQDNIMINSDFLNGMSIEEARTIMTNKHEKTVNYKLNDWCISRQRGWGCPMPFIYCDNCGIQKSIVHLPEQVNYNSGKYSNMLDDHPTWKYVKCDTCGEDALRDTDTMDTFIDSSWYFMRYPSYDNAHELFDQRTMKMMPVDVYIGGIEHAILHLLYARFITKVIMNDTSAEPFDELITQGMVLAPSYKGEKTQEYYHESEIENNVSMKNGENIITSDPVKMSKSLKNTGDIEMLVKSYGSDTIRLFLMSDTPCTQTRIWSIHGLEGSLKLLRRWWMLIYRYVFKCHELTFTLINNDGFDSIFKNYQTGFYNNFINRKFNKMVANFYRILNDLRNYKTNIPITRDQYHKTILLCLQWLWCFTPALADKCYALLHPGKSIFHTKINVKDCTDKKDSKIHIMNNNKFVTSVSGDMSKNDLLVYVNDVLNIKYNKYIFKAHRVLNLIS